MDEITGLQRSKVLCEQLAKALSSLTIKFGEAEFAASALKLLGELYKSLGEIQISKQEETK